MLTRLLYALLLLLSFGLAPRQAKGADCVPVRLDQSGGTLEFVPVMYQDGADTCYAYAASQIADAYRIRAGGDPNHITSPLPAAINYSKTRRDRDNLDGGSVHATLDEIVKAGSCSYEKVGDTFGVYDMRGFLGELKTYYDGIQSNGRRSTSASNYCASCVSKLQDILEVNFDIAEIQDLLRQETFVDFLSSAMDVVCRGNTVAMPEMKNITSFLARQVPDQAKRRRWFQERLDRIQSQRSLPVGVNICKELLTDPYFMGIQDDGNRKSSCTAHGVVMAGRRNYGGRCQVLLRNSMGTSCNRYGLPADHCEDGQVWVDQESVLNNMYGVISPE